MRRARPQSLTADSQPLSACLVFLGCPKNQVDSEQVLGALTEAGYALTTSPDAAGLMVITTCAFIQSAVRESEAAIQEALKLKQGSSSKRVVVAGCLVERYGARLKRRFPEVDLWVPLADMPRIAQLAAPNLKLQAPSSDKSAICNLQSEIGSAPPRVLSTPRHFAYLKIADGCDNRCTYCTIPQIRGPFRSRPLSDVVAEARELVRTGVKELILVAQDTTLYGTDIYGRSRLALLLTKLGRLDGVRWLRLMYTHPAHLTEDVLDQFATNPKLCRYVDLPIQHGSDRLLTRMRRGYTRDDIEQQLGALRAIPDMHVRTTAMVGFPGETAREFEELVGLARVARFDRLSCYAYSPEPGTEAAALPGQVPVGLKRERVRRLMQAQAGISRSSLRRLVGRELEVLMDTPGTGRTQWDAPEIDGTVRLAGACARSGRFVRALVTGSSTHDLKARVCRSRRGPPLSRLS